MFLDEKGEKISKSKGNGLSLEEWLRYGSEPSLSFYIYREPKRAKSLHIGVIPRAVDEYWQFRGNYPDQPIEQQLGNPVHHIHAGKVPDGDAAADLRPAAQSRQPARRRRQGDRVAVRPALCARHVARKRSRARRADRPRGQLCARFRRAGPQAPRAERRSKRKPCATSIPSLPSCPPMPSAEDIQTQVFEVGKRHPFEMPARLVPGALRNPARLVARPAHGQLHRALRDRQQPPADRRGAGECRRLRREDRATAGVEERPFGGIAFGRHRQRLITRRREPGLLFIRAIPVVRRRGRARRSHDSPTRVRPPGPR